MVIRGIKKGHPFGWPTPYGERYGRLALGALSFRLGRGDRGTKLFAVATNKLAKQHSQSLRNGCDTLLVANLLDASFQSCFGQFATAHSTRKAVGFEVEV